LLDLGLRDAAFVALKIGFSFAVYGNFAPFGKRVHRGDAHTVQTARDFVAAAAEFAAGMQDGHDHLQG